MLCSHLVPTDSATKNKKSVLAGLKLDQKVGLQTVMDVCNAHAQCRCKNCTVPNHFWLTWVFVYKLSGRKYTWPVYHNQRKWLNESLICNWTQSPSKWRQTKLPQISETCVGQFNKAWHQALSESRSRQTPERRSRCKICSKDTKCGHQSKLDLGKLLAISNARTCSLWHWPLLMFSGCIHVTLTLHPSHSF